MKTPQFCPPPKRQFYSIGTLCQQMHLSPHQVLALAGSVGVEPDHWRDGIPVFRGDAVEQMLDRLNKDRAALAKPAEVN